MFCSKPVLYFFKVFILDFKEKKGENFRIVNIFYNSQIKIKKTSVIFIIIIIFNNDSKSLNDFI